MQIRRIHALYFSPTQTTRTLVTRIAGTIANIGQGLPLDIRDFTLPLDRQEAPQIAGGELAIVGLPVYAGRLPNLLLPYLKSWKSDGALAVPVVMYGNRSYGNALTELRDILENAGFHSIAAAAFVGRHSFSDKLATGRPNQTDLHVAEQFAEKIVRRIACADGKNFALIELPGQTAPDFGGYYRPLGVGGEPVNFLKAKPVTTQVCTACGQCLTVCPMGAIDAGNPAVVSGICIKCNACIRHCPAEAKQFTDEAYLSHVHFLENTYSLSKAAIELF